METEIEIIGPNDVGKLEQLVSIFRDVFETEDDKRPDNTYLQKLLHKDNFLAVVARVNGQIVGGLTVYLLDLYYSEKPLAYLYDIAVLTAYQRKGIGKKLIAFTLEYCRNQGIEELFVQAEKADDHAISFYRMTQATREEQVIHFSYTLRSETEVY
ncbi:MAG: GNAT family N-acetyltransferase [Bacteroidetes bacterium]|nr:MAG: GNAT family N-acetyltransferase [Bacteroidota bacterium]